MTLVTPAAFSCIFQALFVGVCLLLASPTLYQHRKSLGIVGDLASPTLYQHRKPPRIVGNLASPTLYRVPYSTNIKPLGNVGNLANSEHLPLHCCPVPVKPEMHLQVKDPSSFTHAAFASQLCSPREHSSTSENKTSLYWNICLSLLQS